MTFLTPMLAAAAAAVAVPTLVVLYFLKLRRRDVEVSTTLLWKRAIEDLQANAPFQRLRRNILLLLQLMALAAALLALAQPQIRSEALTGQKHVILIDRSASMGATDGDPDRPESGVTRLDEAKKRALELVDSLKEPGAFSGKGDEAMVIAFDASAEVREGFTSDKAALRRAIESIEQTDAPGRLAEAFVLGKAYAAPPVFKEDYGFVAVSPPASVHLYTDGRLPDADRVKADPQDSVDFQVVGTREAPNVAIGVLRAERAYDDPAKATVYLGLESTAAEARTVDVELSIDGQVASVAQATIPAAGDWNESASDAGGGAAAASRDGVSDESGEGNGERKRAGSVGLVFPIQRREGGVATVRVVSAQRDVLRCDNVGYLVIPPARRLAVAVVSEGNVFLDYALENMGLSEVKRLSKQEFQRMVDAQDPALARLDVFVLDRWLPEVDGAGPGGGRGPGFPPGRSLVFGIVPPPPMGLEDLGEADTSVVIDVVRTHPAVRGVSLDALVVARGRATRIAPDSPVTTLVLGQNGPLVAEASDLSRRAIFTTFDLLDSNAPLDLGFVLFFANAIDVLGHGEGGRLTGVLQPGQTISQQLPAGASEVRMGLPDATRAELFPTPDGRVVFGPVRAVGVYTLSWSGAAGPNDVVVDGRSRRAVAANLLDSYESDVGVQESLALASRTVTGKSSAGAALRASLWPWLLAACLAVVLLEWFVYNRKVTL